MKKGRKRILIRLYFLYTLIFSRLYYIYLFIYKYTQANVLLLALKQNKKLFEMYLIKKHTLVQKTYGSK